MTLKNKPPTAWRIKRIGNYFKNRMNAEPATPTYIHNKLSFAHVRIFLIALLLSSSDIYFNHSKILYITQL